MKLALSDTIKKIDRFAVDSIGIPMVELMKRSGAAVERAVRERVKVGSKIVILAGKGNNGGDGYAAALGLMGDYKVKVYDIFGKGQNGEAGKYFLSEYVKCGGEIVNFAPSEEIKRDIKDSDCIVDAIFGTGFQGEMPEEIRPLAITVREAVEAKKIAIDVPLGINADNGSVSGFAISVNATVELSFIKPGIISYPARAFVGSIVYDDIGLPREIIENEFSFVYHMINKKWVKSVFPRREDNSHKGSFGKLLVITGSEKYRGAAHLSLESAMRGGTGYTSYIGSPSLCAELSQKYPEAIYKEKSIDDSLTESDIEEIIEYSKGYSAILIGSGSDNTDGLLRLTKRFLETEGAPIILDADAINAISPIGSGAIRSSKRKVILTPHPLEFARLSDMDVASVQQHRLEAAIKFAKENRCIVVLKGAGTIITDGNYTYINTVASSSLAKAGSGDVLAGFIGAFVAQGGLDFAVAASLAVYFHSMAGISLAKEYSSYGVLPSELPLEIVRNIAEIEKECKTNKKELFEI